MAEAEAAVRLVDEDAGEAQLGELLPQAVAEPVLAADVAPVAQLRRDRALRRHEIARGVAQHRLIVVEVKGHQTKSCRGSLGTSGCGGLAQAPGSSRIRFAMIPSWISLVPPSIELALVRSHSRAALPFLDRSL